MIKQNFITKSTKGKIVKGPSEAQYSGISTDSRRVLKGELFIPIKGEKFDGHNFIVDAFEKGASGTLCESTPEEILKYENKSVIKVDSTIHSLGEIARHFRNSFKNLKVVCITGSNGKTTTKEMTASILSVNNNVLKNTGNLNNNIGLPLTLLRLNEKNNYCVAEIGMNDFGEIRRLTEIANPDVGAITNIGRAHLEKLLTLEGVARAKGELVEKFDNNNTFIVNADDNWVKKISDSVECKKISYGLKSYDVDIKAQNIKTEGLSSISFEIQLPESKFKTHIRGIGIHNVLNALCASSIAYSFGCSSDEIQAGLERYSPSYMRLEIMESPQGYKIINDSYNANPDSMTKALEELSRLKNGNKTIAILGDMLELGTNSSNEHRQIGEIIKNLGIDLVITYGEFSKNILNGLSSQTTGQHADTHDDAAKILLDKALPGDIVLIKGSRGMKMEEVIKLLF